jgi:hypothetical protein
MLIPSRDTTTANSATPSTSAAVRIMFVKMRPPISGWRAVLSLAEAPMRPMPRPAPITARPPTMPAPMPTPMPL